MLADGYIFDFGKTLVYSVSEITRVYVESNDRNSRMNTDDDYYTIYANTSSLGKVILAWYDHEIRTDAEKFHKEADILKEYLLNSGCTAVINI